MHLAHSTPLQSLLGGLGLPFAVHGLLTLNGSVFGVSGFLHRAVRGSPEAALGVFGLLVGGMVVGALEGTGPAILNTSLSRIIASGLLVGIGTKLANGCTSGHMICGLSRFSLRSLAATATFCATGALTANVLHAKSLPPQGGMDWSLSSEALRLIALQTLPLATEAALFISTPKPATATEKEALSRSSLRYLASFTSSFDFALALRVSNLTDPLKVVSFLILPFHRSFDPSLAFLALGAVPLTAVLYRYARGGEQPLLGGPWSVPKSGAIDARLLLGAAVFGIGWGIEGVCPGPGVVNLGRAISAGLNVTPMAAWVGSVVAGGLVV